MSFISISLVMCFFQNLYNLEFGNLLERTYPIMNVDITTENEIMYIIKAKLILIYRLYKVLIKLI